MDRELGFLEAGLLLVLRDHPENAWATPIRERLETATHRRYAVGAIYTALSRLEAKGMVTSKLGKSTAMRGGRAKRYYRITKAGSDALQRTQAIFAVR